MKYQSIKASLWRGIFMATVFIGVTFPVQAETIVIGKGKGIVWEGLPFNESLSGPMRYGEQRNRYAQLAISNSIYWCLSDSTLKEIGGFMALPLNGVQGVGLIPRATGRASYPLANGTYETLNGTIGLPQTAGKTSSGFNITKVPSYSWCLPPRMTESDDFYHWDLSRNASISGTWALVTDGTQKAGQFTIPTMYFASYSGVSYGDRNVVILPSSITLRVSTLECTVNTPTAINFNTVVRNTTAGSTLATSTNPLITTCGQSNDLIKANINIQFRAISGLYKSTPSRLSLAQGGGYITGEISNGVTGSGQCNATTGVNFDNKPIKIGSIATTEKSKTFTNQLVWRLCSGGVDLPEGPVTASTDMLVTFN